MREGDLRRVVEAVREPIREFVRESRVRVAVLVTGSGQVVAQHGFASGYQIVDVAALAAAAHAAAAALAGLTGAGRWDHAHHAGVSRQLFIGSIDVPAGELILVAIFDEDSSVGLARLFFDRLSRRLRGLPAFASARPSVDARAFEQDLAAGVRRAFPDDEPGER